MSPPDHLSPREQEVLALSAEGYRDAEIADILGITASTVRTLKHRARARAHQDFPLDSSATKDYGKTWLASGIASADHWPPRSFMALLSEPERSALLGVGTAARFSDDSIIVRQGDMGTDLFVLLAGLVKIRVTSDSGSSTVLSLLSRGDLVGGFALIDGSPREATSLAVGEVDAIRVTQTALMRTVVEYPGLQIGLTKYVVAKVRSSFEKQAADRFLGARERLAQVLYDLAANRLEPGSDGVYRLPMTQAALGEIAGVGQSTSERELGKLRHEGIIDFHYRLIEIRDLDKLATIRFTS